MTRFKVTIRCQVCQHRYERVMVAEDEATLERIKDPPCPQCKRAQRVRKAVFNGKAPAVIGASIVVRAIDQTAEIVMQDHKLTDLRSDVREGETAAPKLAPRLQAMADNMFARPKRGNPSAGLFGLSTQAVMTAAVNGRFNTPDTVNPVAVQHRNRDRPPTRFVAGDGVASGRR